MILGVVLQLLALCCMIIRTDWDGLVSERAREKCVSFSKPFFYQICETRSKTTCMVYHDTFRFYFSLLLFPIGKEVIGASKSVPETIGRTQWRF